MIATDVLDQMGSENKVIGLGTGVMINAFLQEVSERLSNEGGRTQLGEVKFVPASDVTASEAALHGVPLSSISELSSIDLLIDQANELVVESAGTLSYIVGRGGSGPQAGQPCLARLSMFQSMAKRCILVSDNKVESLGGSFPVVIDGSEWEDTAEEIDDIFLGDAEVSRYDKAVTQVIAVCQWPT